MNESHLYIGSGYMGVPPKLKLDKVTILALQRAYKAGHEDGMDGDDENFELFLGEETLRTEGIS